VQMSRTLKESATTKGHGRITLETHGGIGGLGAGRRGPCGQKKPETGKKSGCIGYYFRLFGAEHAWSS